MPIIYPDLRLDYKVATHPSMSRVDAWYMVRQRARNAGIETAIGNHSFRAIGITDYLERGGDINIANGKSLERQNDGTLRAARRRSEFSEIERVGI
jgi:integrase/recombinase XerD